MCEKALLSSEAEKKRKKKKPAYLSDTSEEEQVIEDTEESTKGIHSFVLPPSCYKEQNLDEHEASPVNAKPRIIAISKYLPVEKIQTSNVLLESGNLRVPTTEGSDENNGARKKSSFSELNSFDSTREHETTGRATITTLQKQTSTHSGKKISKEVRNDNRIKEILPIPTKQCTSENMTSTNSEIDVNPVLVRCAEDRSTQNHQEQTRNRTRGPMTEEQFSTYYKCLNTKLNHIINLIKDRSTEMLIDERENL